MANYEIYYKDGKGIRFQFPYKPDLIAEIKTEIPGVIYDKEFKKWTIPEGTILTDELQSKILDFGKRNRFYIDESAEKYLGIKGTQISVPETNITYNTRDSYDRDSEIKITNTNDRQYISIATPYNKDLVDYFHEIRGAKYDSNTKKWLVPIGTQAYLDKIISKIQSYFPQKKTKHDEYLKVAENENPGSYLISKGEGYGGRPYKIGEIFRDKNKGTIVKVISAKATYVKDDGMSFGVGDEQGYIYSARVVPATEDESNAIIESETKDRLRADANNRLSKISGIIQKRDNLSPVIAHEPEGETLQNTFDIYGGGNKYIIGKDYIWYIMNNGADGDDWGSTNIGNPGFSGEIGWRVPYLDDLANELKQLSKIKNNPRIGDKLPNETNLDNLPKLPDKPKEPTITRLEGDKAFKGPGTETVIKVEREKVKEPTIQQQINKELDKTKSPEYKGTPEQVNQIIDNITKIETDNSGKLWQVQSDRTPRAQLSDTRQANKITISRKDPKTKYWIRDPGSMDIQGIDTPNFVKRSTVPKPRIMQEPKPRVQKIRRKSNHPINGILKHKR